MNMEDFYNKIHLEDPLPSSHVEYLEKLKANGFEPKVIYDIGSCVLHWTRHAQRIWPNAQIILFDANPYCVFLYEKGGYKYYNGLLSNTNGVKKFYFNEYSPGGASYYREIGSDMSQILYPENKYYNVGTMTLDDVVLKHNFPLPDLIKMDVQGAEKDILEGGQNTISHASQLIMEIPKLNVHYNENAPSGEETIKYAEKLGWTCTAPLFSDNGPYDGDYGFSKLS